MWLQHRGSGSRQPLVSCSIRKSLREMAERLADKYEEAKEKQEDLMNRSVTFHSQLGTALWRAGHSRAG